MYYGQFTVVLITRFNNSAATAAGLYGLRGDYGSGYHNVNSIYTVADVRYSNTCAGLRLSLRLSGTKIHHPISDSDQLFLCRFRSLKIASSSQAESYADLSSC